MKKMLAIAALAILFAGCSKDDDDTTPSQPVVKSKYISCTIDGVKYSYTEGKGGYNNAYAYSPISSQAIYYSALEKSTTPGENSLRIDKGFLDFTGIGPTKDEFKAYFAKGSHSYGYINGDDNGVDFTYYNANGDSWSTYYTDNASSNFIITSSTLRKSGTDYFMDVEGTFSCKIDDANGDVKNVSNGKFFVTFSNQ